jgi:AAA+ superfamily predicted ATPase
VVAAAADLAGDRGPATPLRSVELDALEPRPARDRLPRAAALAELDRELRSVMLSALCAIATAWDTRRLGYGNEGLHPFEHEVAALVGKNAGFAPDYVAAAHAALAEHRAALAADPVHRGPAAPVAELADELGLSPVAIDVLLVIAAPALDGDIARLYGILANDPGRAMVDQLLVQYVLGDRISRHDVAAELGPRAPLIRLGIVAVEPSRPAPFAGLRVDPVVLARLRGEPGELDGAPAIRRADCALDALALAPGVLGAALDALAHAARPARIAIRGRAGAGRRTLLAALAHRAGRALGEIDATALPRDAERFADALRTALRRAQLAGLLPAIVGLDAVVLDQRSGDELAHDALATHPGPLAVIAPPGASVPLPLGHVTIDLPVLSETERLAVWQGALDATGHWLRDVAGLAARYRVGPGVIHRAVAAIAGDDCRAPSDDRIDGFLRQSRDARLAGHARRVERLARWSDLVLPPDVMDSLRELVGRVRHRRTVFEDWGMGRTMVTSRGLTALFQGQPGTGKTLVAGVIARELGLDLYQVDLSKIMSRWIGETERNLAAIFDAAEDGQVILLFDEADSLFAKRTEVRSSNDRYANLEVNYLLQRLDAFDGIAILTTNSGGSIDPAFKRRLSFRLSFPFPDEDTRAELWRAHLPPELPRAGELTFDVLARKYQLSGGYIRNACLRAAFLAAQEETVLCQHHLERAVALEFAELGKLSTTGAII